MNLERSKEKIGSIEECFDGVRVSASWSAVKVSVWGLALHFIFIMRDGTLGTDLKGMRLATRGEKQLEDEWQEFWPPAVLVGFGFVTGIFFHIVFAVFTFFVLAVVGINSVFAAFILTFAVQFLLLVVAFRHGRRAGQFSYFLKGYFASSVIASLLLSMCNGSTAPWL